MQHNKRYAIFWSLEGAIASLAVVSILLFLLCRFVVPQFLSFANIPLYIALSIGGTILICDLLKKLISFEFGSDLLAGISIITAVVLGEYLAGTLVVLMLSGGQAIEKCAIAKASKTLETIAKRAPVGAHRQKSGNIEDISVEQITIGDEILIYPHEICPVDGEVILGNGAMDESYLTGEPFLISKAPGSIVLSGSINGDEVLTIKATKISADSRFAKIMQVMSESAQKRPRIRRLADELGAWYTPLAVIIALCAWAISGDSVRFLAVLVIATPCPLLIAIPIAIIGSISLLAKRGILIKDPRVLEQIDECQTMVFDKTGTLTLGKPFLVKETLYNAWSADEVLRLVASCERYSKHPLAIAILNKAAERQLKLFQVTHIKESQGKGLQARIENKQLVVTNRRGLLAYGITNTPDILPEGAGLECVIIIDGQIAAHYCFRDTPRLDSKSFIKHLYPSHGFKKVMIVSGDRKDEVQYLAKSVGIEEIYANKSPEEKVDIVKRESQKAKTAYIGDGINDAPALLTATVGIAFGQHSDVTAEAAGAVIMEDSLEKVDEFLHVARRMKRIALQSALSGIFLSIIGMGIASIGYLPPVAGAVSQEIIDVAVILNALRTLKMPRILSDIETQVAP